MHSSHKRAASDEFTRSKHTNQPLPDCCLTSTLSKLNMDWVVARHRGGKPVLTGTYGSTAWEDYYL